MSETTKTAFLRSTADPIIGGLAANTILRCDGYDVRLECIHSSGVVELRDLKTLNLVQVKDPKTGNLTAPTVEWMREAYKCGMLYQIGLGPISAHDRQRQFEKLDPDACQDLDPRSTWRFRLALRAAKDNVPITDAAYRTWLSENYGREEGDTDFPRPAPSTLRRWVRTMEKRGSRTGSLVSLRGRQQGKSQLEPVVDSLVHNAALWYWTRKRASQADAYAWLVDQINSANESLPAPRTKPYRTPSSETLRKRINRLRCFDTVRMKYGDTAAAKQFEGSGETIAADRVLEICFMDATTLEQVIVFDHDWKLPAGKVPIVVLLDCKSHVVLGFHCYAGPNRSEMSTEAILNCMSPSDVPPEMLHDYPDLANLFGRPAAILPDNEKALIAPSSIAGLNDAGISVLMPPVGMPTAKAAVERFFRSLKIVLAQIPGTIIDPKLAKDLDYDGVGSAVLTLPQLRNIVAQVVAAYNTSESDGLGGKSPLEMWMQHVRSRVTPPFEDMAYIRRTLGRTMTALLTKDGIELDRVRYRDAKSVELLLNHMGNSAARRSQRKDGSATVQVKVRRNDCNIDTIDVFDTLTNSYVTLPSTQPEYTDKLSLWEHNEFTKHANRRNEEFRSQEGRLASRIKTFKMIDKWAPELGYQQRRDIASLYVSNQVDDLCGGAQPRRLPSDALVVPQITGDQFRLDDGLPPENQARPPVMRKPKYKAPVRPEGYGSSKSGTAPSDFRWDDVRVDDIDGNDKSGEQGK